LSQIKDADLEKNYDFDKDSYVYHKNLYELYKKYCDADINQKYFTSLIKQSILFENNLISKNRNNRGITFDGIKF